MAQMVKYIVGFFNSKGEYKEIRVDVEEMEWVGEETIQIINTILSLKEKMDIEKISDITYIDKGEDE